MLIIYHNETGKIQTAAFHSNSAAFHFNSAAFHFNSAAFKWNAAELEMKCCRVEMKCCRVAKKSNILVFDIFFGVLKLILGYLLLRLPIQVLTSSIIHLQCHLFWHQIRKFYKNNQKLAIFFTWSFHKVLNLDFLVSVNFLYMLLSFKKISFGVQFYKHRRVGFIPIVMNQVYKSLRGAIAPLSLSQKYIFFSKPTISSCKMCKMLFWF